MGADEDRAPPREGELRQERCPNCGGLLTLTAGRAEGYCTIEGIYVEVVLPPPSEPSRPDLVRARVLAATKKELHDLCASYGLRSSGNKTDLLMRLLRYMDERGIDLPPEERETEAVAEEPVEVEPPPVPPPAAPEPAPLLVEVPVEPTPETDVPAALPTADVDELLPQVQIEDTPESPPEAPAEGPEMDRRRLRRDQRVFYAGSFLTAAGGIGLLLGSFLHDVLRVPLFGDSYEAFGPLNVTAAILGGVVLLAGLGAIGFSLRGGVVRAPSAGG